MLCFPISIGPGHLLSGLENPNRIADVVRPVFAVALPTRMIARVYVPINVLLVFISALRWSATEAPLL